MNNIDDVRSIAQIKHIENREKRERSLEKRARREVSKIYRQINRNAQKGMFEYSHKISNGVDDYAELSERISNKLKLRGYEVKTTHGKYPDSDSIYLATELLIEW